MTIEPGTIIAGHYNVLGPLGQGGMGEVFSAENTRTGRRVAIKLLRAEAKSKQSAIERFRREARAAGSIKSEFVTEVLDVEDDPGHGIVLVFELLEGESLIERLKRTGPIPWEELWGIVEAVLVGLEDAHAADIIHRDLKPSNVFLEKRRNGGTWVKILDFGISKLPKQASVETLTQVGQSLGTFSFMPPEQIGKAKSVDQRADIYAATTLVYQALSGKLPYKARNVVHMMDLKRKTEPRTLGEVMRTPVEATLEAFISKGLQRSPDDRFQTVSETLRAWRLLQPVGAPSYCGTVAPRPLTEPPASSEMATVQMSKSPIAQDDLRRMMADAKARRAPSTTQVITDGAEHDQLVAAVAAAQAQAQAGQPQAGQPQAGQAPPPHANPGYTPHPGSVQPHSHGAQVQHAHSHAAHEQPPNQQHSGMYPNSQASGQYSAPPQYQHTGAPINHQLAAPPTNADEARRMAGGTQSLNDNPLAQAYVEHMSGQHQHPHPDGLAEGHHDDEEDGVSMVAMVLGGVLLVAVGFAAVALLLRYLS